MTPDLSALRAPRQTVLQRRFLGRLVRSRRGRAFLLHFMADAEESDEGGVFDRLLARVDDERLHKLVRIHRDDESRHAEIMHRCVRRTGVAPEPVPVGLRIVHRIDAELGGVADRFLADGHGVMEAYVLLQVIEERAVMNFPILARALADVEPESAADIMGIVRDETRHVGYAQAISRKYAPDPETLARTLARYRAAEKRAFEAHGPDFLAFAVERDLLAVGPFEKKFWRVVAGATRPTAMHAPTTAHPGADAP